MPNSPRIVPGVNQDVTSRVLTNDYQAPVFAATISPVITAARTVIGPVALTGAVTFNPSLAQSYIADEITVLFSNGTAGALVVTTGANISSLGTLSVAAGKKGSIYMIFDGATWVESGRAATV
jgi:hypothetical protein